METTANPGHAGGADSLFGRQGRTGGLGGARLERPVRSRLLGALVTAILISTGTRGVPSDGPTEVWSPAADPLEQSGLDSWPEAIAAQAAQGQVMATPETPAEILGDPPSEPAGPVALERLLAAIVEVESHNDPGAVGDGGRAIGPYQIHRSYWRDSGVRGTWPHCREPRYARCVVLAYWRKYCPDALRDGDVEVLARVHNGGPRGHTKASTLRYWHRVQARLEAWAERD